MPFLNGIMVLWLWLRLSRRFACLRVHACRLPSQRVHFFSDCVRDQLAHVARSRK